MVQTWKIARELSRVLVRASGTLNTPIEALRRRAHQGAVRRFGSIDGLGATPLRDVAIFAIYQPGGLSESTFSTLRHLSHQGYATVVVSNAPLQDRDFNRLQQNTVAIFERRNFGYDLGAFQDVIKELPDMGASLNSLILINDSVWFPLTANARLIDQMKEHSASAVAAQMFMTERPVPNSANDAAPILGSYLMMFKPGALKSRAFQGFWRQYRMSSNKEVTIRRGERGLSGVLHRAGVSMGGIYSIDQFNAALTRSSRSELLRGLETMILLKDGQRARRAELLARGHQDAAWEDEVRIFMADMATKKNIISVHPEFCIDKLGVEIVKKNTEMHYRLTRRVLSKLWQGAPCQSRLQPFQEELHAMVAKDELPAGLYQMCCEGGGSDRASPTSQQKPLGLVTGVAVVANVPVSGSN